MKIILVFAAAGLLIIAAIALRNYWRTRSNLMARVSALAPGRGVGEDQRRKRLRHLSKTAATHADSQLVQLVEYLSVVLTTGETLHRALEIVAKSSRSEFAGELRLMLQAVELGSRLDTELSALCERIPTVSVREFANKLSLAMARGTPLSHSLQALARSLRARQAAENLRLAGVNETRMLVPVVLLVCPVAILFALYPSGQFLTIGFM